jgi:hypothetical protein
MKTLVLDFESLEQAVKHFERQGVPLDEVLIGGIEGGMGRLTEDDEAVFLWGDDFWQ